ncbi:hypothetical protein GW17_00020802 [Ensete ventricosum]|nr:hypothetical protein GW17_00020802 [Ensete ventricosum]
MAVGIKQKEVVNQIVEKVELKSSGGCYENSTAPPCTGYSSSIVITFAFFLISNVIIQGDRSKNIGVVDSEYIIHMGIPTLGGSDENKV